MKFGGRTFSICQESTGNFGEIFGANSGEIFGNFVSNFATFFGNFVQKKGGVKTWIFLKGPLFQETPFSEADPMGLLAIGKGGIPCDRVLNLSKLLAF